LIKVRQTQAVSVHGVDAKAMNKSGITAIQRKTPIGSTVNTCPEPFVKYRIRYRYYSIVAGWVVDRDAVDHRHGT